MPGTTHSAVRSEFTLATRPAGRPPAPRSPTLFDLIAAIHDSTADDAQAIVVLRALLRTGAVRRLDSGR